MKQQSYNHTDRGSGGQVNPVFCKVEWSRKSGRSGDSSEGRYIFSYPSVNPTCRAVCLCTDQSRSLIPSNLCQTVVWYRVINRSAILNVAFSPCDIHHLCIRSHDMNIKKNKNKTFKCWEESEENEMKCKTEAFVCCIDLYYNRAAQSEVRERLLSHLRWDLFHLRVFFIESRHLLTDWKTEL